MKVLSVVPSFKILGGVANHYMGLHNYWSYDIEYAFYGKRKNIHAIFTLIPDIVIFVYKLLFHNIDVVVVNPSLRKYQLTRDGIYLLIARLFRKQVVTFIHGWDVNLAKQIQVKPKLFKFVYSKSKFIYVLCSDFKRVLDELNMNIPIVLTTTKVNDKLLEKFDVTTRTGKIKQLLFLARLEKTKGIYELLDAFLMLQSKYPQLSLSVCGSGRELVAAKNYVADKKIGNVIFHGNLSGDKLIEQFVISDIYILPTYEEGMATSVLESMAFGLPIISRPVGGVKDFFVNGEMGILTESLDPKVYADIIEEYINNPQKVKYISNVNYNFAKQNFYASKVAKKFENDIDLYCKK